jgi:hypothetical protein
VSTREYVESRDLAWVEYDEPTLVLLVGFRYNDAEYEYSGVPRDVYDGLMKAPSHGTYFHQHIKSHFQYRKVR